MPCPSSYMTTSTTRLHSSSAESREGYVWLEIQLCKWREIQICILMLPLSTHVPHVWSRAQVFLAENGVLCSGNGFDTVQRSDCAPRTLESSRDHPLLSHGTHPDSASSSSSQEPAATCLQAAAGRVRKSGPGSGVAWLSSIGGEQQPALGRAQRKEARDDRLGMSSCG